MLTSFFKRSQFCYMLYSFMIETDIYLLGIKNPPMVIFFHSAIGGVFFDCLFLPIGLTSPQTIKKIF